MRLFKNVILIASFIIAAIFLFSAMTVDSSRAPQKSAYIEKFSRTFDASETKSIRINNNIYSEVYIRRNQSSSTKVEVKFNVDSKYVDAFAKGNIKVNAYVKNGQLVVESDMALWDQLKVRSPVGRLDIYIAGNSTKEISVSNSAGNIFADSISSNIDLNTTTGNIVVSNINGNLKLDSTTGNISASNIKGNLDLHSNTGNLSVNSAHGKLKLESNTGNIEYKGGLSPVAGHRIEGSTGDILVRIPKNSSVKIEAKTDARGLKFGYSDAKITINLPFVIYSQSKKYFHGKLGDGKAKLYIESGSGDITIQSL